MSIWSAFNTGLLISQGFRQTRMERGLQSMEREMQGLNLAANQTAAQVAQLQSIRESLHLYKNRFSAVLERQTTLIDDAVLLGYFRNWVTANDVSTSILPEITDKEYLSTVMLFSARIEARCRNEFSSNDLQIVEQLVRANGAKYSLRKLAVWSKIRSMMWGGSVIWGGSSTSLFILIVVSILTGWLLVTQLLAGLIGFFQTIETPFVFYILVAVFAAGVVLARSMTAGAMRAKLRPVDGYVHSRAKISEINAIVNNLRNSSVHEFTHASDPVVALNEIENRERAEVRRLGVSDWQA